MKTEYPEQQVIMITANEDVGSVVADLSYIGCSGLMLLLKISKHVLGNG